MFFWTLLRSLRNHDLGIIKKTCQSDQVQKFLFNFLRVAVSTSRNQGLKASGILGWIKAKDYWLDHWKMRKKHRLSSFIPPWYQSLNFSLDAGNNSSFSCLFSFMQAKCSKNICQKTSWLTQLTPKKSKNLIPTPSKSKTWDSACLI